MNEKVLKVVKNTDFWFFIILVIGTILRFYKIDFQSLWNDELATYTWLSGKTKTLSQVIDACKANVHPPLYYLIANFWLKNVLYSEMSLRYLSVIFGICGMVAIYFYGKRFFNQYTGLCAVVLLSLNPFHILHSQNSRPYALLFLLATVSLFAFSNLIEKLSVKSLITYVIVTVLLIYTHYFGLVLLVSQGLYVVLLLIVRDDRKTLFKFYFIAGISIILLYLPWINNILINLGKNTLIQKPKWFFFDTYLKEYFVGDTVYYTTYIILFIGLLALIINIFKKNISFSKEKIASNKVLFLVFLIFFTYFIPYLKSTFSYSVLKSRNSIITLPLLILLVSYLVSYVKASYLKTIMLVFLFATNFYNLFYVSKQFKKAQREQWRSVIKVIAKESTGKDLIVSGRNMIYFQEYMNLLSIKNKVYFLSKKEFRKKFANKKLKGLWVLKAHYKNEKLVYDDLINKFFCKQKEYKFYKAKCIYYILSEKNRENVILNEKKEKLIKQLYKLGNQWKVIEGNWEGIWEKTENS